MTDFTVTPEGICNPTILFMQKKLFPEMFCIPDPEMQKSIHKVCTKVLRETHRKRRLDGQPAAIGRPLEVPYDSPEVQEMKKQIIRHDVINQPEHYTSGKIETWDLIELALTDEEFRGGLKFAIFKYVLRYMFKNGTEDLKKAKKFIDRLIRFEEGERVVHMKGSKAECGTKAKNQVHRALRDTSGT